MKNRWSEKEKQFLIENYSSMGVDYCIDNLHRTKNAICFKAHALNQYVNLKTKSINIANTRRINNYKKYDVNSIISVANKYVAYFLGYLWADGCVVKRNTYMTSINLIEDDAIFLYPILNKISSGWTLGGIIKKSWTNKEGIIKIAKNQRVIKTYSQELFKFLSENDYSIKSNVGFNKIWNKIPDTLKNYFILGLFDGDGTFNYQFRKNKYHSGEFVVTGCYNYDWSVLENYFNKNNIKYSIYRLNVELGQVSRIIVRKKESLITLYNLIYDGNFYGLKRKHIKYLKYYEAIKK